MLATSNDVTTERIERVLRYLKTVEDDDNKSLISFKPSKDDDTAPYNQDKELSEIFSEVKCKIMGQQMEIEERQRIQELLKAEVQRLKDNIEVIQSQRQCDLKSKLSLQRKEYEAIIKRHLSFIDKLVKEKDELMKKGESLAENIQTLEKKYKDKLFHAEEHFKVDLKQQKELWQATEKLKRDKWMAEKTKVIKENTIKSLEPEIQKMLAQHKQQIRTLEEKLRDEFIQEKERIMESNDAMLENIKSKLKNEKDKALEEEREFLRQRYVKQHEQELLEHQNGKKKMEIQFEEDKAVLIKNLNKEFEQKESNYKENIDSLLQANGKLKLELLNTAEELKRKHISEIRLLEEKWRFEKEEWQTQFTARTQKELQEKEKQFKAQMQIERDNQIDLVIKNLEEENSNALAESEQALKKKFDKERAKLEDQIETLNETITTLESKYKSKMDELSSQISKSLEIEESLERLRVELDSKESNIKQLRFELEHYKADKQILKEDIRREFKEELERKDLAFESLYTRSINMEKEYEAMKQAHKAEIEKINLFNDSRIIQLEEKIKERVLIKDEIIGKLKFQLNEISMKNVNLELLIEKQRKELVK